MGGTARSEKPAHINVYVALHDAFATLEQQLLTHDEQRVATRRRAAPALVHADASQPQQLAQRHGRPDRHARRAGHEATARAC
jgi:hypothetical protein